MRFKAGQSLGAASVSAGGIIASKIRQARPARANDPGRNSQMPLALKYETVIILKDFGAF